MKLLIDTNIVLEVLLEQEKTTEARALLARTEEHEFFISDYALHSIGLLLFRQKRHDVFRQFLEDMIVRAGVTVVSLSVENLQSVIEAAQRFSLDFDDAYQHTVAVKHDLTIVSFDSDLARTERGRKTPAEVMDG